MSTPSLPLDALRQASFPMSLRGYDPSAVDEYVELVARLIDEIERGDPQPAVQQAIADIGQRTAGILREAQSVSAALLADARASAEERLRICEEQAEQMLRDAELRVRLLDGEIERLWAERTRLLEDTHRVAEALQALAVGAERRFPAAEPASPPDDVAPAEGGEQ
ncbi:MAG TPA: DivIVA domain-containing protein [Solirubrobacteraceae bacterium]|jgi:DivIVA domain-containing protein|nr:DivIVA domain-containing protein [Solirubrobacteraceae bacterium]